MGLKSLILIFINWNKICWLHLKILISYYLPNVNKSCTFKIFTYYFAHQGSPGYQGPPGEPGQAGPSVSNNYNYIYYIDNSI